MLFSNAEVMVTTSAVLRRQKGSVSKIQVPCTDVIKISNKVMGGVGLIDQRAAVYHLDRKSSIRFYLSIFYDLIDVACANSCIVYKMMLFLIGRYTSRSREPTDRKTGSKRNYQYQFEQCKLPPHLPDFQNIRK